MKIFLIIFIYISTSLLKAEEPFWEYIGGPNGGNCYEIHDNKEDGSLYVSTNNGVFKSMNYGDSWEKFYYDKSIPYDSFYDIGYDINDNGSIIAYTINNEVYYFNGINKKKYVLTNLKLASTYPGYVRLDIDNHNSIILDQESQRSEKIRLVKINLKNLTIDSSFIFRSELENRNNYNQFVYEVRLHDSIISVVVLVSNLSTMDQYSIILLYDLNLKLISKIISPRIWSIILFDNNIIGSSYDDKVTLKSSDLGKTWDTTLKAGGRIYTKDSLIYLFTYGNDSNYVSKDYGLSWSGYNQAIISSNGIVTNSGLTFCYNSTGIYKYNRLQSRWNRSDNGIYAQKIYEIAYDQKGNIYAVANGVQKSTDNGANWEYCGLDDQLLFNILIGSNGYLYVAGTEGAGNLGGIFRSTDEGKTWVHFSEGLPIIVSDLYENKRGHIFAGSTGSAGYFLSTNYGDTWTWKVMPGDEKSSCFSTNSEGHIFRGAYAGIVIRSTDDGDTWEQMSEYFSGDNCFWDITNIAFDPKGGNGYASCLKTTDNGRTWIQDSKSPPDYSFCFDSLGNYFRFRRETNAVYQIYRSTNKGLDWNNISSGIEHNSYNHLSVSPDGYYYLGAEYGGLYRSKQKYVSVEEKPKDNEILIYPNPSNNLLYLKLESESQISIYNLLGLLVLNELKNYCKSIDVSTLDEGMYIIKIKTGIKIKTEKLIIQR